MGTTACAWTLLIVSCGISPIEDVAVEQVDLIEINHYHDELGRPVFDQLIFYDWSPSDSRYQVRAFRMLKSPLQVPRKNWSDGGYDAIWHDGQNSDILRRVHSRSIRESWTQYDPELFEREFLPKDRRRELRKTNSSSSNSHARSRLNASTPAVASNQPVAPAP